MGPKMCFLHVRLDCHRDDRLRVKGEEPIIAANGELRDSPDPSLCVEFCLQRTADSGHMHGL